MLIKRILITVVICLAVALPVHAESRTELSEYLENEIAVDSQTRSERTEALRTLLEQSLVRVTGRIDAPQIPLIQRALDNASNYVIQFGYRNVDGELMLRASFDQRLVLELLDEAGLAAWTSQRPAVLLWVAARSDNGAVDILSRDNNNPFIRAVQQRARLRGLPIFFPLMDLADRMAIEPRDVWGRFEREVREASDRYPAAAVLMARLEAIELEDGKSGFRLDWQILNDAIRRSEQFESESKAEVGTLLVDHLFGLLAESFVVDTDSDELNTISVRVRDIAGMSNLFAVERLLGRAGVVRNSRLSQYQQGVAVFDITVAGPLQRYIQMLALERNLESTDDLTPEQIPDQLEFRWLQ